MTAGEVATVQAAPLTQAAGPMKIAQAMYESGYWTDVKSIQQAYVKILAGEEMGLAPFAAMTGLTIIEGRLGMTANLMATKLQEHPEYDYRVVESTNERCVLEFTRDGSPVGESVFEVADAERAGLVKQKSNWEKWPKAMCFARAISQGIRTYCPIVTNGSSVYVPEELGARTNSAGEAIDVSAPEPVAEGGEVVTEAVVVNPLDDERVEVLTNSVERLGLDIEDVNMILGSSGINACDPLGDLGDHFRGLTEDEYEVLVIQLDKEADRISAENEERVAENV